MTYLIVLAEISEYQPVSVNLDAGKVNAYILDAQLTGLQNVTGPDLYERIVTEVGMGAPSAAVVALEQFYKPYLAFKTCEGLFRLSGTQITRTGIARKTTTVSDVADGADETRMANEMESRAATHAQLMLNYINRHLTDYPEWNTNPDGRPQGQISDMGFFFVGQARNPYNL